MTSTLFISDLHLDSARPDIMRALGNFLQRNHSCDALYILGDLTDAWIGDDDNSDTIAQLTDLLGSFTRAQPGQQAPQLYLMRGNRDFLLGDAFCESVGATLLPDPTLINLYGTPTLLMHGDSLCTADEEYQSFRRMVRDASWQDQLLSQPLAQRRQLAAELRGLSEQANSNKAQDIMDVTPAEVDRMMQQHGVEQLIHGHTHRPNCHQVRHGQRWVLGDWDSHGWVLRATEKQLELLKFGL